MKTVVVTNCTNRKRADDHAPVQMPDGDHVSLTEMARSWLECVNSRSSRAPAASLYLGRSVTEARFTAALLNAPLMFASTGLGLVGSDERCPPYNLTVTADPNSIMPALAKCGAGASDWWMAINAARGTPDALANLVCNPEIDRVFLALSSNYIRLIAGDLAKIDEHGAHKLRIFTSKPGLEAIPLHLRDSAMPYDERLEASSLPGTRNDFPQRSMRHFIEVLGLGETPRARARASVQDSMAGLIMRAPPARRRATDSEITSILECAWAGHQGGAAKLLRYLRDEKMVSCEQTRFRRLWQVIQRRIKTGSN